jgi:secreted PhoX family phosphatase
MGGMDERDKFVVRSTAGCGETFAEVMERRLSRRAFLKGAAAASTAVVIKSTLDPAETAAAQTNQSTLGFTPIQPTPADQDKTVVADGFQSAVLLRWGDPLTSNAPEFDVANQTAEAQSQQFGYNCDFVGFLPLPFGSQSSERGLLVVNHEYTNPELMFPGYSAEGHTPTQQEVDVELAAHGLSVVEIQRDTNGQWTHNRTSDFNRRFTATTPMTVGGPAANHEWLRTNADAAGNTILGTLNNCSAGKTPWGTVVTSEENFHQYFANLQSMPDDDPRKAIHERYGIPEEASERQWENYHPRFDVAQEPNEPFRFGWAVEIDPYDPTMTPVKRTTIGRFRHEAQTFIVTPSGRVAVYSGDDSKFEYVYKFVTDGIYNPNDRQANMNLLDQGTLYVAKFNDDGSGEWLPLVYGQGPLTEANGFTSQGDVLVKTRMAADLLGATKMDRPEDIEPNPVNKKVYMAMTNNDDRGEEGEPGPNAANPRATNKMGHVIEVTETNDDHTSTTFTWEIFLLCGDPDDPSTYFAGFPKEQVSPIANPDNVAFDLAGNLWISTDGQGKSLNYNDGYFAVPVDGPARGHVQQFFSGVAGCEVCGPEFTPNNRTLFLAIQHPGEGSTFEQPSSTWPDGTNPPRPSVVTIQSALGRPIGQAGNDTGAAPMPGRLPDTSGSGLSGFWLSAAGFAVAAAGALIRRRQQMQARNVEHSHDCAE